MSNRTVCSLFYLFNYEERQNFKAPLLTQWQSAMFILFKFDYVPQQRFSSHLELCEWNKSDSRFLEAAVS